MNKAQIKAELRRSALEDEDPYSKICDDAFVNAYDFKDSLNGELLVNMNIDDLRTFFLLVAEAL